MLLFIDLVALVIPVAVTALLYALYYHLIIKGYVRRIKKAMDNGEYDKAAKMRRYAMNKQPRKMYRLLKDIDADDLKRVSN